MYLIPKFCNKDPGFKTQHSKFHLALDSRTFITSPCVIREVRVYTVISLLKPQGSIFFQTIFEGWRTNRMGGGGGGGIRDGVSYLILDQCS